MAATATKNKSVKSLNKQLSSVAKQAKSLGINTSKADAMVAQTKKEGGKSFSGSSYEKDYNDGKYGTVITADSLKTVPTPTLPEAPKPIDLSGMFGMNNAALSDPSNGLTFDGGTFTYDPKKSEAENAVAESNANTGTAMSQLLSYLKPDSNQYEDTYNKLYKNSGVKQYQQDVNTYSSQINSIQNSAEAAKLSLEGQGRGQTSGFVGGEQARISREAAIQALPVQAQLAAAQGNLQMAQQHLDTLFSIKSKDIEAERSYKTNVVNSFMSWATTSQQNLLNAKLGDLKTKSDQAAANLAYIRQMQGQALEFGQSSLISAFGALDPKSPTFDQDIARVQARLSKPVAASASKRDTAFDKDGNLVDMQTGELIRGAGGDITQPDQVQKSLDQISFLQTTINDAKSLVDATGPNLISQGIGKVFVGNTRAKQLATKIDTLKTNLLTLNSDPALKKFFGPQMTEKDTQLLMSAGSTLNAYDASEADNRAELTRYEDLLNRMQTAIKNGGGSATFGIVLTGADGLEYQIID